METSINNNGSNSIFNRILLTGFIAGTLDAAAAIISFYVATGKSPVLIFIYIASAVFGKAAYSATQLIAIVGLLFHYLTAIIFSAFYFFIFPKLKFLHLNKIVAAIIYGIFVWLVMNLMVLPLSKVPPLHFHLANVLLAVGILIVCIGMPVSFIAFSFYKNQNTIKK
ncbi:MAG: hypothetical protein M3139_04410 [Bacteroidota bacterium]|nr:hypothetical protein [Bacteroidota bacterium]